MSELIINAEQADGSELALAKGYKRTELGVIPEDWEVKQIGEISPLQRGFDLPARNRKDGKYPVVYSNGIVNTHNEFQVKGPGVVTGRSGTLGKVHYVENDHWPHNTSLWVTRFNNSIPKFIYFLFKYIGFERFASGSGVPTLNRNDAHSFKVVVPSSKQEQTAIANALSDVDALLSEIEKLISKKQVIKTATMQQLLTGQTRLPEFATNTDGSKKGYQVSELGDIPEDWDVYSFGSLVNYRKGYPFKSVDYQDSGVRIIRVSDTDYSNINNDNPIYISEEKANKYSDWVLGFQDLIVSTVGSKPPMYDSLVGKIIMVSKQHQGSLLNQNTVRIRAKSKLKVMNYLLVNHFRTERYINFIEIIYRGNANQASITLENLFEFKIPLPTIVEEQTVIATILSDMDVEIQALEQQLEKTKQIKQGMMQQLLTGKIRLLPVETDA